MRTWYERLIEKLPALHRQMSYVAQLPEGEIAVGICNFEGRLIVQCQSGKIFELQPVTIDGDRREYMLVCHGFKLDRAY